MGAMLIRALAFLYCSAAFAAGPAKIVLLAGPPSHPPGAHEYNAGMWLLDKCLRQNEGLETVVVKGGWPADESVFDGARTLVLFMDGSVKHPVIQGDRLETLGRLMRKGVGIALLHYAVDVPADRGGPQFLEWAGGYYEKGYSRNPINDVPVVQASPQHPISRGWKTFQMRDEWYHHLRFRPQDPRFTPILTTMLPKEAPVEEVIGWAIERADGGRGFGFTGGHFHTNWGVEEQRKLVLNGILWTAKVEIPRDGARCAITAEDLKQNLDDKPEPKKKKR